jgi:hypothetical protein
MRKEFVFVHCKTLEDVEKLAKRGEGIIFIHQNEEIDTHVSKRANSTKEYIPPIGDIQYESCMRIVKILMDCNKVYLGYSYSPKRWKEGTVPSIVHIIQTVFDTIKNQTLMKADRTRYDFGKRYMQFISCVKEISETRAIEISKYVETRDSREFLILDHIITFVDHKGNEHNAIIRGRKANLEKAMFGLNLINYNLNIVSLFEKEKMNGIPRYGSVNEASGFLNSVKHGYKREQENIFA